MAWIFRLLSPSNRMNTKVSDPSSFPDDIQLNNSTFRPAHPMTATALVEKWSAAGGNVYTFDANGRFSFGAGSALGLGGTYLIQGLTLTLPSTTAT